MWTFQDLIDAHEVLDEMDQAQREATPAPRDNKLPGHDPEWGG